MEDHMIDVVQEEKPKPKQRYIDGLHRTFAGDDGIAYTPAEEDCKLDHRILTTLARRGGMTEGKLANYLGNMRNDDPRFQSALSRLDSLGYINRAKKPWNYTQKFDELTEEGKKVACAPKGEWLGREPYREAK
jgi:hypothetical protein